MNASFRARVLAFVREFFGLSRAAELARAGHDPQMSEAKRFLALAVQRADAAASLWEEGHGAVAFRLVHEALGDAALAMTLAQRPVGEAMVGQIAQAKRLRAPALNEELRPAHHDRFRATMRIVRRLTGRLAPLRSTPRRVSLRRARRIASVALILGGLAYGGYREVVPRPRIEVSASHERGGGEWPATFAFDGDPDTEWMLEDRANGYLQFDFFPPRDLAAIRILNGFNPPYDDRAVRNYRVEVVALSTPRPTVIPGEFEEYTTTPEWRRIELDIEQVTRVRVYADTYHQRGGTIAEVSFEE